MSAVRNLFHTLHRNYRQNRYLASVIRSRWFVDRKQTFEQNSIACAWDYTRQFERERHQQVLARVTERRGLGNWGRVLELGCYSGMFTQELAPRCTTLTACDISADACARTASRCAKLPQVQVQQLNIEKDEIAGTYDLVFAMDILSLIFGRDRLAKVSSKIAAALDTNGLLIVTDCRLDPDLRDAWFRRWVPTGVESIVNLLAEQLGWRLLHREFHPRSGEDAGPHYMAHVIALLEKPTATVGAKSYE